MASASRRRPDVAGYSEMHDCQSLVVWWDETAPAIWGRFVEPSWRGEPFVISGEAGASGPPKVALNAGRKRWLVVWPADTEAGPSAIFGRYVECGGLEGARRSRSHGATASRANAASAFAGRAQPAGTSQTVSEAVRPDGRGGRALGPPSSGSQAPLTAGQTTSPNH